MLQILLICHIILFEKHIILFEKITSFIPVSLECLSVRYKPKKPAEA